VNRNHSLFGLVNKLASDCDLSQVELDWGRLVETGGFDADYLHLPTSG